MGDDEAVRSAEALHEPVREAANAGYIAAPETLNETKRLEILNKYRILDTDTEQAYDDLTRLASAVCGVPISLVSLVDSDRQWFKSQTGLEVRSTPRQLSFCAHAILQPDRMFLVPDTALDIRFAGSPLVTGSPHIRFYAGVPLVTSEGAALGTICVIDRRPRQLTEEQVAALHCLARTVVRHLEMREAITILEEQSLTDSLTSLWNRRAFKRRLGEEWTRHSRKDKPLSLLMIDIDKFKEYNDRFGHQEGDEALIKTARLLGVELRQSDYLVRHGGEEFAVILPETDSDSARRVGERVRQSVINAPWNLHPVTVSTGIGTIVPTRHHDENLLMARADQALYRAKKAGRNRVEVFNNW